MHHVPYAAAQRDPPDPHRAGVPESRREAVGARRSRVFACCQAGLGPSGAPGQVDLGSSFISERSSTIPPSVVL